MNVHTLDSIASREVITVSACDPLTELLALMEQARISCVLAVDGDGRPEGIFTEYDAVRLIANGHMPDGLTMADVMNLPVLQASGAMDYRAAYHFMAERHFRHLAVVDESGRLTGVVSETDFVRHVGLEYLVEFKTVADLMTRQVVTLGENHSLAEASRLMAEQHLGCIVVLRDRLPVGILTERDMVHLARKVVDARHVLLGNVMHAPVRGVTSDTCVPVAARIMAEAGIRRLLVIEQEQLVGLVTRHDIAKTLDGHYVEYLLETIGQQKAEIEQARAHIGDLVQRHQQHEHLHVLWHALNAADNAIIVTDLEAHILWANPAFSRLSGYGQAEVLGRKPSELVGSGKQDRAFYQHLWATILAGKVWHGELVNKRKDGSHFDEELTITPVLDERGQPRHFVALMNDISQRKQVLRELHESQLLFSTVVNSLPAMIWRAGVDKGCNWFSQPWLNFRNRSLEQERGDGWLEGVHPEDAADCMANYERAFDAREGFVIEYRLRRHDGEYRWIYDQGLPHYDLNGAFLGYLGSCLDVTENKLQALELERLATTDGLSGLANRRHFLDQLTLALARYRRHVVPMALLMLDLDHFKHVNDSHGHAAGDAVLQHFARLLQDSLRQIDFCGRLGGEEFVVLLPDTGLDGARDYAERVRQNLIKAPALWQEMQIPVTVSIGVTVFHTDDQDIDTILARADRAQYRAKRLGRNRVEVVPG